MAKAGLNEHVRAGMQVWYSKQMVWKFSKKEIQALQAAIMQLVRMQTQMHVRARTRLCKHGKTRLSTAQLNSAWHELSTAWLGLARLGSARLGSARLSLAQHRTAVRGTRSASHCTTPPSVQHT